MRTCVHTIRVHAPRAVRRSQTQQPELLTARGAGRSCRSVDLERTRVVGKLSPGGLVVMSSSSRISTLVYSVFFFYTKSLPFASDKGEIL